MRRSFFSLLVVSSLASFPALAEDITVDSAIKAATVYNDRAMLTRTAIVDIPAGAHNLIFKGLPINIDTNSLRTKGSAVANVQFGALSHKRENFEDFVVPRQKELNAELQTLQDQNKVYNAEKQALKTAQEFLKNLGQQAVLRENEVIAKIDLNPDNWAAAADGLSSKMAENLKASLALDFKIRDVNEKIKKIQNDLRQLRSNGKQNYIVSIPFESDKATKLSVDLSYQISGVSWQPIYDARLDVKGGKLDLVQYGSVWQQTGEDWEDVALTLSTAQPSRGTSLPDLYSNWLSLFNQGRGKGRGANTATLKAVQFSAEMDMAESAMPMEMAASAPMKREVSFQAAQINTEGFVGEYKITGPASVKSDGTKAKLLIGSFDIESALQVQIKPQISTDAYLVAKVTLKGEAPILPGQVNLFRDGAYIGQSYMKMLRPDGVEQLAFGIDDNVTVKRNTIKDERSEAGMITKDIVLERHYVTDIQNLHKETINIAVLETVPVSKDENISVEILKDHTTPGYESDLKNVKGVTRWMADLEPKAKAQVKLGWKVSWPKGQNISGL